MNSPTLTYVIGQNVISMDAFHAGPVHIVLLELHQQAPSMQWQPWKQKTTHIDQRRKKLKIIISGSFFHHEPSNQTVLHLLCHWESASAFHTKNAEFPNSFHHRETVLPHSPRHQKQIEGHLPWMDANGEKAPGRCELIWLAIAIHGKFQMWLWWSAKFKKDIFCNCQSVSDWYKPFDQSWWPVGFKKELEFPGMLNLNFFKLLSKTRRKKTYSLKWLLSRKLTWQWNIHFLTTSLFTMLVFRGLAQQAWQRV